MDMELRPNERFDLECRRRLRRSQISAELCGDRLERRRPNAQGNRRPVCRLGSRSCGRLLR